MLYLLLVTWIYPDQPPASYQIEFPTEKACMDARSAVYAQVIDLRKSALEFNKAKIASSGVDGRMGQLMMANLKTADASATCVKR